jgi:hypothetical protein
VRAHPVGEELVPATGSGLRRTRLTRLIIAAPARSGRSRRFGRRRRGSRPVRAPSSPGEQFSASLPTARSTRVLGVPVTVVEERPSGEDRPRLEPVERQSQRKFALEVDRELPLRPDRPELRAGVGLPPRSEVAGTARHRWGRSTRCHIGRQPRRGARRAPRAPTS